MIVGRCNLGGQIFITAHPAAIGDPFCTGCKWVYPQMWPGKSQLVEVWNGPWSGDSNNEQALTIWYDWLNQGHRLVATAGSDAHRRQNYGPETGFSIIFAESLTEDAILLALRQGRLYLGAGPQLSLIGHNEQGREAMMGDALSGKLVTLSVEWNDCPQDATLRLIVDGNPVLEQLAQKDGHISQIFAAGQANVTSVMTQSLCPPSACPIHFQQIYVVTDPFFRLILLLYRESINF